MYTAILILLISNVGHIRPPDNSNGGGSYLLSLQIDLLDLLVRHLGRYPPDWEDFSFCAF
ncbi:6603_t:CDS:2 [Entrophospora sp. SA101]|nr:6603_t:CDS:2 [Entrophospora sp. SA101]CAJ0827432.1 15421_t:CDS:2 [Entrophospora sp. SA101]